MSEEMNTVQQQNIVYTPAPQPVSQVPPATPEAQQYYRKAGLTVGMGIAGLIFSFMSPLIGLILGIITLIDSKKGLALGENDDYRTGKTLGTISIIVSIVLFVLIILFFVLYFGMFFFIMKEAGVLN